MSGNLKPRRERRGTAELLTESSDNLRLNLSVPSGLATARTPPRRGTSLRPLSRAPGSSRLGRRYRGDSVRFEVQWACPSRSQLRSKADKVDCSSSCKGPLD